jgi:arylsulfatase
VEKFRGRYDAGWDVLREERFARQREMGLAEESWRLSDRAPGVRAWAQLSAEEQADLAYRMEVYAAQVTALDQNIGRLLEYLESTGEFETTLILFFSDNGACAEGFESGFGSAEAVNARELESLFITYGKGWANVSNTPFRLYKHYVHEGGITSPAILSWPDRIAAEERGRIVRTPAHIVDVMPTFIEAANTRYPWFNDGKRIQDARGMSLLGLFRGEAPRRNEPLFFEHEGNQAIREGNWKLVLRAGGRWQLYNLKADRSETLNLAELEPERVEVLKNRWRVWSREVKVLSLAQFKQLRKALPEISPEDEG